MERPKQEPLAIIGMACRVPGAQGLDGFWQLLIEGGCGIVEVPADRLDRSLHYDGRRGARSKTYTTLAGVIDYPPFDPSRCPVPARTLPSAEVGHQTMCQVAAAACRHAGMNPFDLPLRNVGVYVGHNLGGPVAGELIYATRVEETAQYLRQVEAFRLAMGGQEDEVIGEVVERIRAGLPRRGPTGVPDPASQIAATILSDALGLTGPSMILDAACSSALQGLAMASRALRLGRIDMALVGGASYVHVDSLMLFSQAQSASAKGSCPFDDEADGLVSGEGYVAVLVKTLRRAIDDGDPIWAVIRGIGVSSDGRGKSLWAPRQEGQVLAMRRAYEGGLDMNRLQFIEAHATSTRLGDLTELKALAEVLGHREPGAKVPLGGVKANIGHTLEAAGLLGLVKAVLAMQHKTIPRQINLRKLNSGIDWDAAPFYVPTSNEPWPEFDDGHPRRAAVNSFGIGGLNVHVVLDEHREPAPRRRRPARRPEPAAATPVHEPIAVVGAGCIFPGARTLDAFWDLVGSGRDPKCDVPPDRWDAQIAYEPGSRRAFRSPARRGGFVTDFEYDWRRHKVPPKQVAHADPLQLMILDATDAALADAGYDRKPYDRARVGVVVGTVFGSDFCEQLQMGFRLPDFCAELARVLRSRGIGDGDVAAIGEAYCETLLEHMPALLDETGGFTPSALASRITKTYDLMGGAATIDAGQASSLAAIYSAVDALLDGSCDMVVCAAGHRAMGLSIYEAMSLRGDLAGDDPRAPFDARAQGCLPGEGVGVVVLKRLADAQRDGDRIRAVIRGIGAGFAPSRGDAVRQSIERAYQAAGETPERLVLLETSGTGRPELDDQEVAASAEGLSARVDRDPVLLGSVVAQIGHTQGASGMASLVVGMRSLETLEMPATFAASEPAPSVGPGSPIRLATTSARLRPRGDKPPLAGIHNTDALGAAYHLVLEPAVATSPDRPAETPTVEATPPTGWRIVRIGATSERELAERAGQGVDRADDLFARADSVGFTPQQPCRLAIVAEDVADLRAKLTLAARQIGTPKAAMLARKDIFVGRVADPVGKVAFLFSGQGSQYPGMLEPLVDEFPPAAEALGQIDATLGRLDLPPFAEFAWRKAEGLGSDVWLTQLSLLCADTIVFCALQAMGIRPDYVAGHSFGEFPALAAAGAWDFENAVRGTRARCEAIEACRGVGGTMLSTVAPGPVIEPICREIGGVYPANYNAPDQTVVGGDEDAIVRLEARLTAERIACKVIPVPRPFHTPLMAPVKEPLARGLAPLRLRPPQVPVLSNVTNRFVSSADEIRANLVAQMTTPIRYVDLIDQLAGEGVRAMVEVGPRQVLTGLHGKILAGRDVAAVACDDKTRHGFARLLAVRACLETLGLCERPSPAPPIDVFAPAAETRPAATPVAAEPGTESTRVPQDASETEAGAEPLVLAGTPYEIGRRHGAALAGAIRRIARRYADVAGLAPPTDDLASIGAYQGRAALLGEDEREELRGIADGAGVSFEMLSVYNAWVDACGAQSEPQVAACSTPGADLWHAFAEVPSQRPAWADRVSRRDLRVYRPNGGFAHAVASGPGMLGASVGLNERGLAVSSAAAAPSANRTHQVLRTVLVRRVLQNAADIDAALELLREAARGSGWEFVLSHGPSDRICRVRFAQEGEQIDDRLGAIGDVAGAEFDVTMTPGRGEIALRSSSEGRETVARHRLEPAERPTETRRVRAIPIEEYLAATQSVDGQPPFDRSGRVCSRFVLRMLETRIPPVEPSLRELNGPAMIAGSNAVGLALRKRIESLGQKAVVVPISDDPQKTLAAVEKIWQAYRPPHLFLVTPLDDDATAGLDPTDWERRRRRGVMLPYLVCQKWFERISSAKMVEQASVVAATAMGGDFGLSGRIESLESGAVAGLIKALSIEVGYTTNWAFRTKVIDVLRREPPDAVAAAMLRELRAVSFFAEIGYAGGRRYVIGALHQPAEPATQCVPTRGRPWLITGGARGITAAVAQALGDRFGVKLHLVGTSPRPRVDPAWRDLTPAERKRLRADVTRQAIAEKKVPADAWKSVAKAIEIDKNLRDMARSGIEAVYHACDVSDRAAMTRLVDAIRRTDGPIEGIVHGAGIENACRFVKKNPEMVSKTFAAKVDGAAVLMDLTRDDPPRFFFGFGSVAGRWGSIGQTDYGPASDMLAKLIDWYRAERPECRASCFHWQPWADVGMAARDETRGANVLQLLQLLPASEGIEHFVDELLAGAPEPEVLVTDWDFYKRYHPDLSPREVAEVFCPMPARPRAAEAERAAPAATRRVEPPPSSRPPSPGVAMRHVMRLVEVPWEATVRRRFAFAGPALILGDNADAKALGERLAAAGVESRPIPLHDTADETLAELQWLWGTHPSPHLFVMTGRDPEAARIEGRDAWLARRHRGVMLPFLVCQKWLALVADAGLLDRASVVAATSLGGDFGFSNPVVAPEGGALAGLVKGLYMELGGKGGDAMRLKVVDAPAGEPPERLAEAILRELDVEGIDVEVACAGARRSVVRLAIEPVEALVRDDLPRGGTWVFTGGARGITAAVAKELGRRYGLKLHLLGKSPAPSIDPAWRGLGDAEMRRLKRSLVRRATAEGKPPGAYWDRVRKDLEIDGNLRELEAAGVEATYHACDVTDWDDLEHTLQRIRQADGPIRGVVHGAGIQGDAESIGETTPEIASETIDVKVDAAVALLWLTRDDPVDYWVGFGSISGRFGSNNAVVYSMASDMLCKLMGWRRARRPGCRAVGVHWHPWGEVGMMTRPEAQHTVTVMKMRMMPPAEGASHLIDELRAGAPEAEVLITDAQFYETFYSKDLRIARADVARADSEPAPALIRRTAEFEPGRRAVAAIRLDPVGDPFLREHRLRDKPTLPMVIALEAFAETARLVDGGARSVTGIRDVQIPNALRFFSDEPREVRVHAEREGDAVRCRLTGDFRNRRGHLVQKDRPHFSAVVELGAEAAIEAARPATRGAWFDMQYPPRDALLYHGPPLRLLERMAVDGSEGWGEIRLPGRNELAGNRDPRGWLTPSAAIDACCYACGVYTWVFADRGVTVPDRLAELRFGRPGRPSERCVVHLVCRGLEARSGRFDFTLFGDDGSAIFQAREYRCHVLRGGAP